MIHKHLSYVIDIWKAEVIFEGNPTDARRFIDKRDDDGYMIVHGKADRDLTLYQLRG